MATALQNTPNTFDIPLHLIVADPKKNSRTTVDQAAIQDLAETIEKEGQLTPGKVEKRADGKFPLVFGYRRFAALKLLHAKKPEKFPTMRVEVVEEMDLVKRKLANIAENLAREDLTTFDQAMAFDDLKRNHDMKGPGIANSVGKSIAYVNNLSRMYDNLEPCILKQWEKECEAGFTAKKVCTLDWLGKVAANVPRADQEHELMVQLGLEEPEADDDGETGRNPKTQGAPKRATKVDLDKALESALEKRKEAKAAEGGGDPEALKYLDNVVAVLNFAVGKSRSIKGVYTSPKPE